MKYAVIAAGEGSRLANEGVNVPKPLVGLGGKTLIDRLLGVFMDNDASEIDVICNDLMPQVKEHLEMIRTDGIDGVRVPLRFIVKSTPSSMHSFYELSGLIEDSEFCLTTVDTVFGKDEFARYIVAFRDALSKGYDGLMAVTDYIDDESPLYIGVDDDMNITGFYDDDNGYKWVSGGIYGLTPKAVGVLRLCMANGVSRMRNFQRALVAHGLRLKAFPFRMIFDIDHAADIEKAKLFVSKNEDK